MEDYTPIDPYAEGLKKLTAARTTPEQIFEDHYKADRFRALAKEHGKLTVRPSTPQPRLTAAELATYEPPDSYAAAIKVLQSKEAR